MEIRAALAVRWRDRGSPRHLTILGRAGHRRSVSTSSANPAIAEFSQRSSSLSMDRNPHDSAVFMDTTHEVPIFVSYNVFADALGTTYAFACRPAAAAETLQTLIYNEQLRTRLRRHLLADVSTFNHELAESAKRAVREQRRPALEYPPLNVT